MKLNPLLKRATLVAGLATISAVAMAASHSDAPMMVLDPAANITDVYAFVRNNAQGQKTLNLIMAVNPLEDPGNGVIYDRFADDVLYTLHISKARKVNGQMVFSGSDDISYNFRFRNSYKNGGTILSYGLGTEAGAIGSTDDARQNFLQTYSVTRQEAGGPMRTIANGLKVPPVNVGPRTTPGYYDGLGQRLQGATSFNQLPSYVQETAYTLNDGTRVFAGQREDGFYADVAGIFDFIGVRDPGKDGFSGYNVHIVTLQIPIASIVKNGEYPIIGVYGTTSRQSVTVRNQSGQNSNGNWVQVSRMGNPLFNEVLVALADKDRYNMLTPATDTKFFKKYAERNEVAFLLNAVLGTNFQVNGRTDLVGIFMPDLLRVDLSTPPVPIAGEAGFNRLSFLGGNTVTSGFTGQQVAAGWPNGRRLGDDVVDIALTAIASGPNYNQIIPVGDNVNSNDTVYDRVFPYAGTPWGGPISTLHP